MRTSGIYQIQNVVNGKKYIGSAVDLKNRESGHWSALSKNKHKNARLQNSWNKHGSGAFVFKTLLICSPKDVLVYEQICIDKLNPEYNICKKANSLLGHKWTEESKYKMRGNKNGVGNPGRSRTGLYEHEKILLSNRMKGNKYALGKGKKGEENFHSKLTSEQVLAIRDDTRTYKEISAQYGTCISNISFIKNKRNWGHL